MVWIPTGSIKGDKGDPGPKGDRGEQGPQGLGISGIVESTYMGVRQMEVRMEGGGYYTFDLPQGSGISRVEEVVAQEGTYIAIYLDDDPYNPNYILLPPGPQGPPGITPHIGGNGNWWIGETDTGVSAGG